MKKLFMVLCVIIMFFGLMGCPSDDPTNTLKTSNKLAATPVAAGNTDTQPNDTQPNSPVPEPATMLLLGAGLVGLAGAGRKKFFKKDQGE